MEKEFGSSDRDKPHDYTNGGQWQDIIQLLKLTQGDYQMVRRRLEEVDSNLAERENIVNRRLQYALQVSGGYRTLRLLSHATGSTTSTIGNVVLGELDQPTALPDSNRLEIYCLGRFEIRSTWKQVNRWRSVKAKSVFQYLITRYRKPVIKEVLMEALWPECDPQAANNNLKAAVHSLRITLGDLFVSKESAPYVLFEQGSYLINPGIDLWVDVNEFERHWLQGQLLEKEGKHDNAIREYQAAEALYRGDYLEDEPYQEWTLLQREALKDTCLLILGKLADHSMNNADYDSCITHSQKILAKDSCREDAYRRLMRCYSRLGQRNRALRWYEICRQTIQTELDTTPDTQTTDLYHRLLSGEPID